jgi:hypothetical protein
VDETKATEIESIHVLDSEMTEQTEFDLREDLLLTNEIAGAGAEFVPTDFLNNEDANEDFALEPDAEIQSMNVIEDEIIFRDSGFEMKEKDEEETEIPLRTESENLIPFLTDISYEEIEKTEGEPQAEISLHINEEVISPGEFLPDKFYTYSQWLHFFRYDATEKNAAAIETEPKEQPKVQEADRSFGATMQLELESIDRIVSSIKIKMEESAKDISPEELAKKSLELNEDIVSETLARIYEEQGKHDKAIRQYVKLSLIYPDKVAFFAARIKELKGKK